MSSENGGGGGVVAIVVLNSASYADFSFLSGLLKRKDSGKG